MSMLADTKDRVVRENREVVMPPLKAWERRVIHLSCKMMKRSYPNQSVKEKTGFLSFVRKVNLEKILFFLILLFLPTQFGKHFYQTSHTSQE